MDKDRLHVNGDSNMKIRVLGLSTTNGSDKVAPRKRFNKLIDHYCTTSGYKQHNNSLLPDSAKISIHCSESFILKNTRGELQ
jgi:hypothetical protein